MSPRALGLSGFNNTKEDDSFRADGLVEDDQDQTDEDEALAVAGGSHYGREGERGPTSWTDHPQPHHQPISNQPGLGSLAQAAALSFSPLNPPSQPLPPLQFFDQQPIPPAQKAPPLHNFSPLPALAFSALPPLPPQPASFNNLPPLPPPPPATSTAPSLPPLPALPPRKPRPTPPYAVDPDEGLIRCVCPFASDDGFTIQCDLCNAWQHAGCVMIHPEAVPEEYLCEMCDPEGARARGVDKARATEQQRQRIEADKLRLLLDPTGQFGGVAYGQVLPGLPAEPVLPALPLVEAAPVRPPVAPKGKPRKSWTDDSHQHPAPPPAAAALAHTDSTATILEDSPGGTLSASQTSIIPGGVGKDAIGRARRKAPKQPKRLNGHTSSALTIGYSAPSTPGVSEPTSFDKAAPRPSATSTPRERAGAPPLSNLPPAAPSDDDDGDVDRYAPWQYEFTPVERCLYPEAQLLSRLEAILAESFEASDKPPRSAKPRAPKPEPGMSVWEDTRPVTLNSLPPLAAVQVRQVPVVQGTPSLGPPGAKVYASAPVGHYTSYNSSDAAQSGSYARPHTYGLFATEPIMAGAYLAPVVGQVTDLRRYRAALHNQYALLGCPKPGVRVVSHPWECAIDGRLFGNEARFARNGCHPNAVVRMVRIVPAAGEPNEVGLQGVATPVDARSRASTPWAEQRKGDGHLAFALFATADINKKDEVVVPWDWDDHHVAHVLPSLLQFSSAAALPAAQPNGQINGAAPLAPPPPDDQLELIARKMSAVSTALLNATECACTSRRDCAVYWMTRAALTALPCPNGGRTGAGAAAAADAHQKQLEMVEPFAERLRDAMGGREEQIEKEKAAARSKHKKLRRPDCGPLLGLERRWIKEAPPKEPSPEPEVVPEPEAEPEPDVESVAAEESEVEVEVAEEEESAMEAEDEAEEELEPEDRVAVSDQEADDESEEDHNSKEKVHEQTAEPALNQAALSVKEPSPAPHLGSSSPLSPPIVPADSRAVTPMEVDLPPPVQSSVRSPSPPSPLPLVRPRSSKSTHLRTIDSPAASTVADEDDNDDDELTDDSDLTEPLSGRSDLDEVGKRSGQGRRSASSESEEEVVRPPVRKKAMAPVLTKKRSSTEVGPSPKKRRERERERERERVREAKRVEKIKVDKKGREDRLAPKPSSTGTEKTDKAGPKPEMDIVDAGTAEKETNKLVTALSAAMSVLPAPPPTSLVDEVVAAAIELGPDKSVEPAEEGASVATMSTAVECAPPPQDADVEMADASAPELPTVEPIQPVKEPTPPPPEPPKPVPRAKLSLAAYRQRQAQKPAEPSSAALLSSTPAAPEPLALPTPDTPAPPTPASLTDTLPLLNGALPVSAAALASLAAILPPMSTPARAVSPPPAPVALVAALPDQQQTPPPSLDTLTAPSIPPLVPIPSAVAAVHARSPESATAPRGISSAEDILKSIGAYFQASSKPATTPVPKPPTAIHSPPRWEERAFAGQGDGGSTPPRPDAYGDEFGSHSPPPAPAFAEELVVSRAPQQAAISPPARVQAVSPAVNYARFAGYPPAEHAVPIYPGFRPIVEQQPARQPVAPLPASPPRPTPVPAPTPLSVTAPSPSHTPPTNGLGLDTDLPAAASVSAGEPARKAGWKVAMSFGEYQPHNEVNEPARINMLPRRIEPTPYSPPRSVNSPVPYSPALSAGTPPMHPSTLPRPSPRAGGEDAPMADVPRGPRAMSGNLSGGTTPRAVPPHLGQSAPAPVGGGPGAGANGGSALPGRAPLPNSHRAFGVGAQGGGGVGGPRTSWPPAGRGDGGGTPVGGYRGGRGAFGRGGGPIPTGPRGPGTPGIGGGGGRGGRGGGRGIPPGWGARGRGRGRG